MGEAKPQLPLRITPAITRAARRMVDEVYAETGYQGGNIARAARRWCHAVGTDEYVWLSIAGAATPVGLGGTIADLIARGHVDAIVSTGANVYHDLHFASGLPVRHGRSKVDDDDLRRDETTRIYDRFIHNRLTLKGQDFVNQYYARRVLRRIRSPFSTATFLHELGREMLEDDRYVIDRKGSMVLRAAEYGVPIFLDSGSNHSLGMDLSLLALEEGLHADTSPTMDILEAAALSMATQPQVNVFLGEGGPRNFTQTTAPTAAEIFYLVFEGSEACVRLTTADERTGGLSGSGQSEAVTWGKYLDANPDREIEVWSEYTITAPLVMAYVGGMRRRKHRRLMNRKEEIYERFKENVRKRRGVRKRAQARLERILPDVMKAERRARKRAGYKFD